MKNTVSTIVKGILVHVELASKSMKISRLIITYPHIVHVVTSEKLLSSSLLKFTYDEA